MRIIDITTQKGEHGWHAYAVQHPRRWGTHDKDEPTAVWRAACAALYGPEPGNGWLFAQAVSVFVLQITDREWVALQLDPDAMAHDARRALVATRRAMHRGKPNGKHAH